MWHLVVTERLGLRSVLQSQNRNLTSHLHSRMVILLIRLVIQAALLCQQMSFPLPHNILIQTASKTGWLPYSVAFSRYYLLHTDPNRLGLNALLESSFSGQSPLAQTTVTVGVSLYDCCITGTAGQNVSVTSLCLQTHCCEGRVTGWLVRTNNPLVLLTF